MALEEKPVEGLAKLLHPSGEPEEKEHAHAAAPSDLFSCLAHFPTRWLMSAFGGTPELPRADHDQRSLPEPDRRGNGLAIEEPQ